MSFLSVLYHSVYLSLTTFLPGDCVIVVLGFSSSWYFIVVVNGFLFSSGWRYFLDAFGVIVWLIGRDTEGVGVRDLLI